MPSVLEITDNYRDRLAAREATAERSLKAAYVDVYDSLRADADILEARIIAAVADGVEVTPYWLYQQERYRILQSQVTSEIGRIAEGLGPTITQLQAEAVVMGKQMAIEQLVESDVRNAVALPNDQLIDLVGRLSNGSPLNTLLDDLGPQASEAIRNALVTGIGTGGGVQPVARQIRDALGGSMARAQTIARTEVVSSYRRSGQRNAMQFAALLAGWRWSASLTNSPPPCASCIANHGKLYPIDEPMATHQNCRCVQVYTTKNTRVDFGPSGEEWFEAQTEAKQRDILAPSKYRAYKAGEIGLDDLIQRGNDPEWGPWQRERSLSSALGKRRAREFYQQAADD